MRRNASFHPEWGYLAPAPSFIRTVRMVFIATAVGAAVGAGVGSSTRHRFDRHSEAIVINLAVLKPW